MPLRDANHVLTESEFLAAYQAGAGLLWLRPPPRAQEQLSAGDLAGVASRLLLDRDSWTVENAAATVAREPAAFLDMRQAQRGYCSFIVQRDEELHAELLRRSPCPQLPVASGVEYGGAVWVFVARNGPRDEPLEGRPPHTDSVSHDGTFHYQLAGVKTWRVEREGVAHTIECCAGDVLVVDTKHWMHSTLIGPQPDGVCVSLARDIYIGRSASEPEEAFTNVDGMYAVESIAAHTLLFRASDHPNLELGRSVQFNCDVVELSDGELGVVTVRDIAPGDFFCIAPSSSEE